MSMLWECFSFASFHGVFYNIIIMDLKMEGVVTGTCRAGTVWLMGVGGWVGTDCHCFKIKLFDSFAKLQEWRLLLCDAKINDSTRELLATHSLLHLPRTEICIHLVMKPGNLSLGERGILCIQNVLFAASFANCSFLQ